MAQLVQSPYPVFTDSDGTPLDNGFIYIGVENLNPISNPAQVYWDEALTIPAVDIRTLAGYPSYNGTPGRLYTANNYSIVVKNSRGVVVFTSLSVEVPDGVELTSGRVALGERISDVTGSGDYVIAETGTEVNEMASGLLQIAVSSASQRGTALIEYGWADGNNVVTSLVFKALHIKNHVGDALFDSINMLYKDTVGSGMKIRLSLSESTGSGAMRIRVQKLNIGGNGVAEETDGLKLVDATTINSTRVPSGSSASFFTVIPEVGSASEALGIVELGTAGSITGLSEGAISALNSTDVAFACDAIDELRVYRFNGVSWSQVGSGLSINFGRPTIAALNTTDVAVYNTSVSAAIPTSLQTYRWNGSTWAAIGNPLTITGTLVTRITALSSTDIAFVDISLGDIRRYSWDGTNWSQIGTALSISGIGTGVGITALNNADIAFFDTGTDNLRTYRWTGSTWALIGSVLNIPSVIGCPLTALSNTEIVLGDSNVDTLQLYRWDGASWTSVGVALSVPSLLYPYLTTLSPTVIATLNGSPDEIQAYTLQFEPPSPAFN